ncbi:hypothetical protein ACERK3_12545 [Phycisphaerales bacterium AB-hyl4]|uniref:Glycosyl transferase family 8 n=1 Tax=Natronomicrosphaera hydrolytica TaxID=3242702 RepID=A0ABV4U684_9BACT
MHEKYDDNLRFYLARLRRGALRAAMTPICNWQPLHSPAPGYTVVIGCPVGLTRVLFANLALLQQQRREHLHEVIIAFDVIRSRADHRLLDALRKRFDNLPLRFLFYDRRQARVLDAIGWAWCYCWLNWALPLAHTRTRYAIIHDLDALLLDRSMLEQRYHAIRERGDHYVGVNYYHGNGIVEDDRLAVTFEMACDVRELRLNHHPIDLFNRITRHQGRRIEFDTFLYPQRNARRSLLPLMPGSMVHPTQLVCQYVELHRRARYVPPARNNLPMLAYMYYLAGDELGLERQRQAWADAQGPIVDLLGRPADCRHLAPAHTAWLTAQIERVEHALADRVRDPVRRYLDALNRFADRQAHAQSQQGNQPDAPVYELEQRHAS